MLSSRVTFPVVVFIDMISFNIFSTPDGYTLNELSDSSWVGGGGQGITQPGNNVCFTTLFYELNGTISLSIFHFSHLWMKGLPSLELQDSLSFLKEKKVLRLKNSV